MRDYLPLILAMTGLVITWIVAFGQGWNARDRIGRGK